MKFLIRLRHDSDNSYPLENTEVAATDDGVAIRLQGADADRNVTVSWDDWEALVAAMPKRIAQ